MQYDTARSHSLLRGVNCHFLELLHRSLKGEHFNPFPHGMFWTKVIYDLASSEPYSLSSLNSKNLKKYVNVRKGLGNTLNLINFL